MHSVYLLFIILTATDAQVVGKNETGLRVYNGDNDRKTKYPYVVSLMYGRGSHGEFLMRVCSGTLIHKNWVLTAAHCLIVQVNNVQFGNMAVPLSHTETKCKVLKMIQHPSYMETVARNDIGLLMVTTTILPEYGKISATDFRTLPGKVIEFAGYGSTFLKKRTTRFKLMLFLFDIFRPLQLGSGIVKSCEGVFSNNLICMSPTCSRTQFPLPGDSGGPMFCDNKIIAVACAITMDYSEQAFTPVSPYLTWISKIVTKTKPEIIN